MQKITQKQNETQNERPEFQSSIEVGITGLKTKIVTRHENTVKVFIPTVEIMLRLPSDIKGAHMSRLVQAANAEIMSESKGYSPSMEIMCKRVIDNLFEAHYSPESRITLNTEIAINTVSPVSNFESVEVHEVVISVCRKGNEYKKSLSVTVKGSSVCPHAMNNNAHGRTHIQRSVITIRAETDFDNNTITMENLIEIAEQSFSARVYSLVKSVDEQSIINNMFENPKFVEDICRDVEKGLRNEFKIGTFHIEVINQESIHRHDVKALKEFTIE